MHYMCAKHMVIMYNSCGCLEISSSFICMHSYHKLLHFFLNLKHDCVSFETQKWLENNTIKRQI